jgi:hypothetical protein
MVTPPRFNLKVYAAGKQGKIRTTPHLMNIHDIPADLRDPIQQVGQGSRNILNTHGYA